MKIDATQVTGSPAAHQNSLRPGDVLAERYELLELVDAEGPSLGYRARDQETERAVLVRVLAGPGLPERTLGEVLERLRALIGVGGRHLSPLCDVDREGKRPFTVEAWPSGIPLSALFAERRMQGTRMDAATLLPIAARVAAALDAIPARWHHGDVRAERVWVDGDALSLTSPFLLAALPPVALAERLELLGPGAIAYAPEARAGRSSASADRWGLAAIVWEALTGREPDPASSPPELSVPLRAALVRMLDPEPGRRAKDASILLGALAEHAGLPVPAIDPEPMHSPDGDFGRPPSHAPPRRRIEGAAEDGTQEVSLDQILEERVLRADDELDPDLVAAALATDAPQPEPAIEELPLEKLEWVSEPGRSALRPPPPAVGTPSPPASSRRERTVRAASGQDGATAIVPRPVDPRTRSRSRRWLTGPPIVLASIVIAIFVIGLGFYVRAELDARERARAIQDRLEQIRRAEP